MLKCNKCDQEATYDSPENLCDDHWVEWWFEEDNLTPEELKKEQEEHKKRHLKDMFNE